MFTILFTAVGRRVGLIEAFRNSLKEKGIALRLIGVDPEPHLAPAAQFLDGIYPVPKADDDRYIEVLSMLCESERVDVLIPLYEPEFLRLDAERDRFQAVGTRVLLSEGRVLRISLDKWETWQFFHRHHIKTPKTIKDIHGLTAADMPVMTKPRFGMGSVGLRLVKRLEELEFLDDVQNMVFQHYVSGIEYTMDVLADFDGKVISVVPRERLMVRAGEVIKSRTVKRPDLMDQCKRIVEALGAIGPLNLQCIDTGNEVYWIEINPRFGGGVPLTIRAGVDYPYLIYRICTGQPVEPMLGEFQDNLTMLRYDQAVYL
ncbi:MAG TPA: ATP-grasp domain-containing protein [Bacillota bacterium]|nr:ATP-grasp domain-containing protein [Bacillota bacterium]HPT88567.1 ATP-grasp domain-containing protein [Bacillota bacterium]